jgi:20S proteasome alpha/beta subunit
MAGYDYELLFFSCRYHIDPSGTYIRFEAKAIGAGSEGAQSAIQESYTRVRKHLTCVQVLDSFSYPFLGLNSR